MQIEDNISKNEQQKTLKDFIPLVFAFYGGLVALSIFQNTRLYFAGVLDSVINKSFFLLLLHHTGFTALVALLLAFWFNYRERKKYNSGFKSTRIILIILLVLEGLLVAYYVQNYQILGAGIFGIANSENIRFFLLPITLILGATVLIFHYLHKSVSSIYTVISRMYPFTIILFSLFLATLNSSKKAVNENKTQYLFTSVGQHLFDFNNYEGAEEYPLLHTNIANNKMANYFNLKEEKPNIVIVIVEGLGNDFIGANARFKGFAPGLEALSKKSLNWENFLANSGTSFASLPMITGSLPFGEKGFTNVKESINRHTLFSILKSNEYVTSFNYGGNSAINRFDKFLDEERVDHILDKNSFGEEFKLQEEDAAGITLGYPDKALFKKWESARYDTPNPKLEIFFTLSSKNPFSIPDQQTFEQKVQKLTEKLPLSEKSKKLVRKNEAAFASILYADQHVSAFITAYQRKPEYENSIIIITGSHALTDIPPVDELGRYRVPFMIYSPLLKKAQTIQSLASHADITPSLIQLLEAPYQLKVPQNIAWLGSSLINNATFDDTKQIAFLRDINNIQDYIIGRNFLSEGNTYELQENLELQALEDDSATALLKGSFSHFKSVNKYVTEHDKIIPPKDAIWVKTTTEFSKTDLIWIESVFNGKDIDNAYQTARKLAFDKEWKRALLLCSYILDQTPRHADTEVLMGRIYSWQKEYIQSENVLNEVIRKYPKYEEGYAALLDTYFWADTNKKAILLFQKIERHPSLSKKLKDKIARAKKQNLKQQKALLSKLNSKEEAQISSTNYEE